MEHSNSGRSHYQSPNYPSSTHGPAHHGDPSTQYQPSLQTNHDANYYSSNNDPQSEDDQYSEPTHTTEGQVYALINNKYVLN